MIFSLLSPAESTDLDVLLDDAIVEAAWKRRVYPKRVLEHVVHSLRAERRLMVGSLPRAHGPTCPLPHMPGSGLLVSSAFFVFLSTFCVFQGLHENAVPPEEVLTDPDQGPSSNRLPFYCCSNYNNSSMILHIGLSPPVLQQEAS